MDKKPYNCYLQRHNNNIKSKKVKPLFLIQSMPNEEEHFKAQTLETEKNDYDWHKDRKWLKYDF